MPAIALVHDQGNSLAHFQWALERAGFEIWTHVITKDARGAIEALAHAPPDLIIIARDMPGGMDGPHVLQALRQYIRAPAVLWTSLDPQGLSEIYGTLAFDEIITIPMPHAMVLRRLEAVLRRHAPPDVDADRAAHQDSIHPDLSFDTSRALCTWKGEQIFMTVAACQTLRYFATHPDKIIKRAELMTAVFEDEEEAYICDSVIDGHILSLRKTLLRCNIPLRIDTLYGVGYRLSTH